MSKVYANVLCHVVFSTKNWEPLLSKEIRPEVYRYMLGIGRDEGARPIEIGGIEDHVHLLAAFPPSKPVSLIIGRIKGSTSRWIDRQSWFTHDFAWQRGYAVFSVSQSLVDRVSSYIRSQEEHHRNITFDHELDTLLRLHGIDPTG
jgi:REP element-mobilizing transposase RayT